MKPGPVLVALALGWFILGAVGFFSDFISLIWLYTGLLLLPVIAADGLVFYFFCDRFEVKREIPGFLAQGEIVTARLEIKSSGKGFLPFRIQLWDLHPDTMQTSIDETSADVPTAVFPALLDRKLLRRPLFFEYPLLPIERGQWAFKGTELLLFSFCLLWRLKVFHPCHSSGRCYPNFKRIKAAAGMDLRGLLESAGLKNIRMRGLGLEFRNLRDYQEGDSIRAVDWRATSRRRKVIIREYQEEQDQQILFLLDSGYRLNRKDGFHNRPQFETALESVLLLSWVSLRHGDSVAVGSFGAATRWLGPRKGLSFFPALMNGLYDLKCGPFPSSPFAALEDALARLKRRTFIVLVSNFREEDGESLSWILKRVEKRHLLLLVSLREKESEYLAARKAESLDEALESAAAFSYLRSRRELYKGWEHSGLLTLESSAEDLSSQLINRYLEVKRSGRL